MAPKTEQKIYVGIGLDFETGGLDCRECACTQIALQAVRFDTWQVFDRYQAYIAPYGKQDDQLSAQERAMLEESISQHARQATGVAKAPYVCQFVRALLDGGEKVLLFAHHHQVMDIYKQELKAFSPGFITGRETTLAKMNAVDRFQSGRTDVLCISLRAASGLNLQRATCVVFGELDWSPAVHSQAEDRAHRMGQEDSLLCYYLVAPQGSDAVMQEALGLKVSQFVGLMGDAPQSPEQAEQFANQARRHVERIVAQMGDNSGSPINA